MTGNLAGDLVDGLGESLDVGGGDTGDGDAAVLGGVDGVLLGQLVHLLGGQACVCEHADLCARVSIPQFQNVHSSRRGNGKKGKENSPGS